jgi:threonyl-tRNA synthetase
VLFSTRPDKSVGTDEAWARAEASISEALDKAGLAYEVDAGAGSFYGPKIDIDVRDAIGRYWQLGTIQVDFQTPDRFGLSYVDSGGERVEPVMIHRALYGAIERFFGVLVEHFAGAFPTWLAPVQAVVIPIADRHNAYARAVADRIAGRGARVEVDDSDDTIGAKIRRHEMQKVPYMLVVGDDETASDTVSVRRRSSKATHKSSVDDFAGALAEEIAARTVEPAR